MITVKVNLIGTEKNKQKISLSFSKTGAKVQDIIESLSEMYPSLKEYFLQENGDFSENFNVTSTSGSKLQLNTILTDQIIINIDIEAI